MWCVYKKGRYYRIGKPKTFFGTSYIYWYGKELFDSSGIIQLLDKDDAQHLVMLLNNPELDGWVLFKEQGQY